MNTNWLAVTFNFLTSCLEIIFCAINHRLLWKKCEVCHHNGHLVSCDKLFWIVNWWRIYYQSKLLNLRSLLFIIFTHWPTSFYPHNRIPFNRNPSPDNPQNTNNSHTWLILTYSTPSIHSGSVCPLASMNQLLPYAHDDPLPPTSPF